MRWQMVMETMVKVGNLELAKLSFSFLELICYEHQIKHIDNPVPVHVPLQTIRPKRLRH